MQLEQLFKFQHLYGRALNEVLEILFVLKSLSWTLSKNRKKTSLYKIGLKNILLLCIWKSILRNQIRLAIPSSSPSYWSLNIILNRCRSKYRNTNDGSDIFQLNNVQNTSVSVMRIIPCVGSGPIGLSN